MNHCVIHERLEPSGYCETCSKMFCMECSVDHIKSYPQHQLAFLAVITANLATRWPVITTTYEAIDGTLDFYETEINKKIALARKTYENIMREITKIIKEKLAEDICKLRGIQQEIKHTKDKTRNKKSKLVEINSKKQLLFKFYNAKEYDSILALQKNVNEFTEHTSGPEIIERAIVQIEQKNKSNLVNGYEKVMEQPEKYFKSLASSMPIVFQPICSCCKGEMEEVKACSLCFKYVCSNCIRKCSKCPNDLICKDCQVKCEKCNSIICKNCEEACNKIVK